MADRSIIFDLLICLALGALVGRFSRRSVASALIGSCAVSAGFAVSLQWLSGSLSRELSLKEPVVSAMYLAAPFLLMYFLPTASMSLLILRLRRKLETRVKS